MEGSVLDLEPIAAEQATAADDNQFWGKRDEYPPVSIALERWNFVDQRLTRVKTKIEELTAERRQLIAASAERHVSGEELQELERETAETARNLQAAEAELQEAADRLCMARREANQAIGRSLWSRHREAVRRLLGAMTDLSACLATCEALEDEAMRRTGGFIPHPMRTARDAAAMGPFIEWRTDLLNYLK